MVTVLLQPHLIHYNVCIYINKIKVTFILQLCKFPISTPVFTSYITRKTNTRFKFCVFSPHIREQQCYQAAL